MTTATILKSQVTFENRVFVKNDIVVEGGKVLVQGVELHFVGMVGDQYRYQSKDETWSYKALESQQEKIQNAIADQLREQDAMAIAALEGLHKDDGKLLQELLETQSRSDTEYRRRVALHVSGTKSQREGQIAMLLRRRKEAAMADEANAEVAAASLGHSYQASAETEAKIEAALQAIKDRASISAQVIAEARADDRRRPHNNVPYFAMSYIDEGDTKASVA